jgi:hypothetical protein
MTAEEKDYDSISGGGDFFPFATKLRVSSVGCVLRPFSFRIKRLGNAADLSPPTAQVTITWNLNSTLFTPS